MRTTNILTLSTLLSIITPGVAAQPREWIVDVQNRPGTDHTDRQAAFDAVPETDRIFIRGGVYPTVVLRRGLVVRADPAAQFQPDLFRAELTVRRIPGGKRAVLTGFDLRPDILTGLGGRIAVDDCAGNVHLEALTCTTGVTVSRSRVVTITEATWA